jgi:hypothetical protein|tara:strand:- start:1150 stop:1284 length:135 start_codon:yes stop_codon:yes gene_type:complete
LTKDLGDKNRAREENNPANVPKVGAIKRKVMVIIPANNRAADNR